MADVPTGPVCETHGRALICPACIGSRGGKVVSAAKIKALRRATKLSVKARRRRK